MVRIQLFSSMRNVLWRFQRKTDKRVNCGVFSSLFNLCKSYKHSKVRRRYTHDTTFPTRQIQTTYHPKVGIFSKQCFHLRFSQVWPLVTSHLHYFSNDGQPVRPFTSRYQSSSPLLNAPVSIWHFQKFKSGWWCSVQLIKLYSVYLDFLQLEWWRDAFPAKLKRFAHQLRFRFVNSRFTLLFTNPGTRADYFFVSPGLFTRYFFFQKAVKRSKTLKLIMIRFARKMLLLLGLNELTLAIRGLAFMLEQLIVTLLSPLRHPFKNVLTGQLLDEVNTAGVSLRVGSIAFSNVKPFGFQKTRLKGRIKRKIRRRIHRVSQSDY